MLLGVLLTIFSEVYTSEGGDAIVKPCSFPIPLEMPNRNDRADQCWLRIEDVELVETVTIPCHIAHSFLRNYIHDYNSKKMIEDGVNVSLWSEDARPQDDAVPPSNEPKGIKDWKRTTVLDPITHMRLYVTKNADCKIVMYSREGMSNYKVDCERVLYYVNGRLHGRAAIPRIQFSLICICIFLVLVSV